MTNYLIIGSGVAAAAVAQKLLDNDPDTSITMLEAGTQVPMKNFALYQDYMITGNKPYYGYHDFPDCRDYPYPEHEVPGENASNFKDLQLQGSRVMMYGGSTVHWGGWSFRLKPEDFNLHSNTGKGIDWPIEYDDLEPFYGQAENFIGVAGDSNSGVVPRSSKYPFPAYPFTKEDGLYTHALDENKIKYNHLPIARHGITNTDSPNAPCKTTGTCKYCPFGARFVAANYIDNMVNYRPHPNFKIILRAYVKEILMTTKAQAKGVV